jgi:hypothetical protein
MGIVINNPSSATLADNSVTTAKIADGAVTPAKLSTAVQGNNRNYIINSDFKVAQATTSVSVTAGNSVPTASLGYPVFDCWFVYCIGGNITQVAQFPEGTNSAKSLRIMTVSSSVTSIGIGQRIEAVDAVNLATKTVTLSFECSHTFLTSLTITASRPTSSANTFGTIASPTKTQIATTTISITSTSTRYSWTFTCPQEVEMGLEILFTLGAADNTARYFYLANVKLEEGSSATTFIPTIYAEELRKCQRYFIKMSDHLYTYYTAAGNVTSENLHLNMFGTTRIRNLISTNPIGSISTITIGAGISADSTKATYTSSGAGYSGGSPIYTVSAYIP